MTRTTVFTMMVGLVALGCGDSETTSAGSGGNGGNGGGGSATTAPMEWTALVRGTLFTQDLMEAQMFHDGLASGGEEAAKSAGDFGHDALLGTTLLGTTENAFVGLDRWTDPMGMAAFYADPAFGDAFGMLFSGPPTLELFEHRPDWHQWGDLTAGDGADMHWFVVVRGRLAESDPATAQQQHDAVAAQGEAMVRAAGDVAHVVYVGLEDEREFFAVDVWTSSDNIEAVYGDPDFVAAFGSLFSAPPNVGVYASTDWYQW